MAIGVNVTWSFDEAIRPGRASRRVPRGRAWLRPLRLWARRAGFGALAGLVFVYLTLAGYICARWCDIVASAAAAGAAHNHHTASTSPLLAAEANLASPTGLAPAAADGECRWQVPNPSGWLVPLVREPPVPAATLALGLLAVVDRLRPPRDPAPVLVALPPPDAPPRSAT